ncbi:MarR family transcriptional regulator [Intrasporangium sp.]|uniref:MarR family winged helix-turn-helix transcriptional regulator n=1 Tax=Intrasporangium sp. TaxID=1925024 RepID=UPI003221ACAC
MSAAPLDVVAQPRDADRTAHRRAGEGRVGEGADGGDADEALRRLAGDLRAEVNRLAYHLRAPATRSGITPTRLAALAALAHAEAGLRAGDLAARMGISPASTSRLIELLVGAGWAARTRDPQDARAVLLTLTDLGRHAIEDLRRDNVAGLAANLSTLGPDERAVLAAAIPLLRALSERLLAAGSDAAGPGT